VNDKTMNKKYNVLLRANKLERMKEI
jgi:hypothetical protein